MTGLSRPDEISLTQNPPAIRWGIRVVLLVSAVVALGLGLLSQAAPALMRGATTDYYVRLQPFLGLMAIAVFAITAALVQRVKLEASLSLSKDRAEQAWQIAVDANRTARLAEQVAGIGYWSWTGGDDKPVWSDGMYRIFGRPVEAGPPTRQEWSDPLHPDDIEALLEANRTALATGQDYQIENRLFRPDGDLRHAVGRAIPQRDEDGRIIGLFGTVVDVTDLKRAQAAAVESEGRFRVLADAANDMITRVRPKDGIITFVSPSSRQITGYEPEEMLGTRAMEAVHPDDAERVAEAMRVLVRGRRSRLPEPIAYRYRHKDGRWVWLEANPTLTLDEAGEPLEFIDVVRDVSQAKAVAAELELARSRAESATAAKSEFLANMSHELRTPLTSIIGFSRLLRERTDMAPEPGHFVKRIHDASEALLSVVNDVLDFSKLEAGQVHLDAHPFSPAALLEDTVELVSLQAESKGLALSLSVDPAVPGMILGDFTRLRQVLLNLVSNAVKFTAEGSVRVEAVYLPGGEHGRLRITVADTGAGVPADRLDRLFQRFSQAETSINRTHGGTGLGLAICKGMIELMGGDIGVETEPGKGSTFWFEAPVKVAVAPVVEQAPADETAPVRSARILLVDDTPINRELVRTMLSPLGLSLEEAGGGAEAVQAALERPFDLILMDVRMPGIDGMAATRAIRTSSRLNGRTPIVALTADVQPENIAACRAAGMDDHIGKPISPGELIPKIIKWSSAGAAETAGVDEGLAAGAV